MIKDVCMITLLMIKLQSLLIMKIYLPKLTSSILSFPTHRPEERPVQILTMLGNYQVVPNPLRGLGVNCKRSPNALY